MKSVAVSASSAARLMSGLISWALSQAAGKMRTLNATFRLTLLACAALPVAAQSAEPAPACTEVQCTLRLTAEQLLAKAEALVSEHRFGEAAPMLAALENAPQVAMERNFLIGYTQVESGQIDKAIKTFRSILAQSPEQTRVRMELGRALMMQGKALSADHHFRLAQQDSGLPEDIAGSIRATRGVLRQARSSSYNVNFGLAPDSNITGGTNAESIDVSVGPFTVPLALDANARSKSGTGQFASFSGSARAGLSGETRLLIDGDTQFTNYRGKDQDDLTLQLAAGPEFAVGEDTTVHIQALGAQRVYGGKNASRAFGLRAGLQSELGEGQRIGLSIDARRSNSGFTDAYSGWQFGGFATYERVIGHKMIASASVFGRREALTAAAYSDFEVGGQLGIGGELPLGINASLSGGASRAWYDAPLALFSSDPRKDWRLNGRVELGLRSMRVLGFSPSVAYSYSASLSSLTLYDSKRSKVRFALARYF
jgi:outer membrane protein